jgi:prephenate dehydrogenase
MPLNITILGLGAVGASLGLALGTLDPKELSSGRPAITGWDTDRRALNDARGRLAIDRAENDLEAAVREADVVFVCVPFEQIRDVFAQIGPVLRHGTILSDTSEAKVTTLRWASELIPATVEFIGGHPLIAVGGSSIREATPDVFRDSIYCLVPLPRTKRNALDGLEALITAIGAKPYYIDAAEHDSYVAAGGHLPLAIAVALMETVGGSGGWREIMPIAGEGLLTMTEFASGDPQRNAETLASNADALDGWIERVIHALRDMQSRMRDPAAVEQMLQHAYDLREEWVRSQPNTRPGEDAFHGNMQDVERASISGMFFGRRPSQRRSRDKR